MAEVRSSKRYDLEERTLNFAKRVIVFVNKLSRTMSNIEVTKQLVRSSTSVGANYIEANESLGRKDFVMRIKICRKEAKESCYWLRLINISGEAMKKEQVTLIQEATELMKIFGSILEKSK